MLNIRIRHLTWVGPDVKGLCFMKLLSEKLQNLSYFFSVKIENSTCSFLCSSFLATLFPLQPSNWINTEITHSISVHYFKLKIISLSLLELTYLSKLLSIVSWIVILIYLKWCYHKKDQLISDRSLFAIASLIALIL